MVSGETIAAIATAPGRAGVAVVRVSGPDALGLAARLTGRPEDPGEARGFGVLKVRSPAGPDLPSPSVIDECVVLRFRAPRSYTGEDVVEFQCHGGAVTPRRVLEACLAAGARLARRGEFTQRAFLNGRLDYEQAEAVLDLIEAKTDRAADAALEALGGRRARARRALYEQALDLSTRLEHALDVDEGELAPGYVRELRAKAEALRTGIAAAIRRAREGKILREGALVVLAGPPNAGKSSLMNALLEENRVLVSDRPGTTRDSIEEWMDLGGWPIRLTDTAGLRAAEDAVEGAGVKRAEDLVKRADVVVWLEAADGADRVRPPASTVLRVFSKCDLARGPGLNVSSKTGEGLEELRGAIVAKLEERAATAGEETGGVDEAGLREALAALGGEDGEDLVLLANEVRRAAERLGAAIGATYSSDLLDNLFSRFCVGK